MSSIGWVSRSCSARLASGHLIAAGVLAGWLITAPALAVPVTGWLPADPPCPVCEIQFADTNHPVAGDGYPESLDNFIMWAELDEPMALPSGEQVVLSGKVQFFGATVGAGNGAFRWGLAKDMDPEVPNPTAAWLGYLALSAGGDPTDGSLYAKNPDRFDWLTSSFFSTFPGTDFVLATGAGVTANDFANNGDVYEFQIIVARYADEVIVTATMNDLPIGDYNDNGAVDAADYTVWRDNLGTAFELPNRDPAISGNVSEDDYTRWKANFGSTGTPKYNYFLSGIDYNGLVPPPGPYPPPEPPYSDHVPFDFDRVGFLFADHLNADQASFWDIDLSTEPIQSLTLEVDTATGASRLLNASSENFDMIYYEITSESGSLVEANWTSFDDAEGGDPTGVEWDEAGGSDENALSEINLLGTPKSFPASGGATLWSLGDIWNTGGEPDLRFYFIQSDGSLVRGAVTYIGAGAGGLAAVPEPGALGLCCWTCLCTAAARRRRRRP